MRSFFADVTGFTQLREGYMALGAVRFWAVMAATLAYIIMGTVLAMSANWPGNCDHEGRRLIRLVKEMRCSPDLLGGGVVEIGLFIWLWSMPVVGIVAVAWSWINHYRRKRARTI